MKNFWLFLSNILSDLSNPQLTAREKLAIITDIVTILGVFLFNIIPLIIVAKLFDISLVQLACLSGHIAGIVFKYAIPLIALFMMLWGFNKSIDWLFAKFNRGINWLPIVCKIILIFPLFFVFLSGFFVFLSQLQLILSNVEGKC